MRMRLNFTCLIFVARNDYENILTVKISRFTVLDESVASLQNVRRSISDESLKGMDLIQPTCRVYVPCKLSVVTRVYGLYIPCGKPPA